MARTTVGAIKELLDLNYDTVNNPSLNPYLLMASAFVDRVVECAVSKGITLSTTEKELIERAMGAHFYTKTDPVYQSRSTLSASGSFVRNPKEPEPYKDLAISLDPSGCVAALLNRNTTYAAWLGKRPSEQTDYDDRD